jgi:hypothetical protein
MIDSPRFRLAKILGTGFRCLPILLLLSGGFSNTVLANSVANQGAKAKDYPVFPRPPAGGAPILQARIDHGEYLIKIADCLACHTDEPNRGEPFAGGLTMIERIRGCAVRTEPPRRMLLSSYTAPRAGAGAGAGRYAA